MDFSSILILSAILFMEQKAFAASLPAPREQIGLPMHPDPKPQHREKRCSCENLKDRECVYFCHIGIVWVNTPSHVIPYGVGFLPTRLKRHVERCLCADNGDSKCITFCSSRTLRSSQRTFPKQYKARVKLRRRRS